MAGKGTRVSPAMARRVLDAVAAKLPPEWVLMPIGGTWMGLAGHAGDTTTKDVDIVVLVADGPRYAIPDMKDVVTVAREIGTVVDERKDHTSVVVSREEEEGFVTVELVRGRAVSGGYFVTQRVLKTAAATAARRGRTLELPPEALAFLKAWAANDKEKLVASGRDERGYHAGRLAVFKDDVARIRNLLRAEGRLPDDAVFAKLHEACGKDRQKAIRRLLEEGGW